ncbi:hypothetical protein F4804DRAFT_334386 [Jackrogersella minutella]|nr:hypothetical protein F4804DRAFT_334386 [Jackrogersella minutella]
MAGTVIFTGANCSLGIPAINHLLHKYPEYMLILTVRDRSEADVNTNRYEKMKIHTSGPNIMQRFFLQPFLSLHRLNDLTMRTATPAGIDVAELALNPVYVGERGFFTFLKKDHSSPESQDEGKQQALWTKSLDWVKITKGDTDCPYSSI